MNLLFYFIVSILGYIVGFLGIVTFQNNDHLSEYVLFWFSNTLSIPLTGSSTVYVSADRVVAYLRIESEGSERDDLSDELSSVEDEITELLSSNSTTFDTEVFFDTLGNSSYQKNAVTGPSVVYTLTRRFHAETSQEALAGLFSRKGEFPNLYIDQFVWKLSDELRTKILAESSEKAMEDLVAKGYAFIKPLGLKRLRASSIRDTSHTIQVAPLKGCRYEIDNRLTPKESGRQCNEMERQPLEVSAHVSAIFEAY